MFPSYRNQSVGFYMMGTLVVKGLNVRNYSVAIQEQLEKFTTFSAPIFKKIKANLQRNKYKELIQYTHKNITSHQRFV